MVITPGTYLRLRREAAGLSAEHVARMIDTEVRLPEHALVDWLSRIEADVVPATFRTIACLRCCFSFDLAVFERLAIIAITPAGRLVNPPRLCRVCGCGEQDACNDHGRACGWTADDRCSACAPAPAPDDDPDPDGPSDGEVVPFGIDPDDRGDGQSPRHAANDPLEQREYAA